MVKRLTSVDVMRGFFIGFVIFLHPLVLRSFSQKNAEFSNQIGSMPIGLILIMIPIFIVAIWGSVFTLLSGTTTAFQISKKIQNKERNFKELLTMRFVNSGLILVAHFILLAFFMNKSSEHPLPYYSYSLFTGSLQIDVFTFPGFLQLLISTTLQSIAYTGIFISLVLYISWRKNGYDSKKAIRNLALLTILIFVLSLVFDLTNPDPYAYGRILLAEENYFVYYIYTQMFVARFSICPVMAFGSVGAIFGIIFADDKITDQMWKYALGISVICFSIFAIALLYDFDIVGNFAKNHMALPMHLFNLGIQVWVLVFQAKLHDFRSKDKKPIRENSILGRISTILKRYSSLSLTIFLFESLLSIIFYRLLLAVTGLPGIDDKIGLIVVYDLFCILIWFLIINNWDKHHNKYSAEWMIGKAKKTNIAVAINW